MIFFIFSFQHFDIFSPFFLRRRLKRDGGSGADTPGLPPVQTSTPHHKLLQPKTEFIEEPSNTEDDMAVLEDEEDYGPNPGTSQASFSSQ
ncbi:unnamed protein product, partial [Nesidiocoris tenuis]